MITSEILVAARIHRKNEINLANDVDLGKLIRLLDKHAFISIAIAVNYYLNCRI
jgi:hypothetical protein